jgi:peptidyl-prolyl cis-trans isomerase-like protein 2
VNLSATGGASKLVAQLKAQREEREAKRDGEVAAAPAPASSAAASGGKAKVPYNAGVGSSGMMAASFTSSGMTPQTRSERQTINEEEFMLEQVAAGEGMGARKGKKKGNARAFVRVSRAPLPATDRVLSCAAPRYRPTLAPSTSSCTATRHHGR